MKLSYEEMKSIMTEAVKEVIDYCDEDEMFYKKCKDNFLFFNGAVNGLFLLKLKELEEGRN